MTQRSSWTKSLFVGLWNGLNFVRKLFFNIVFIVIIVGLIVVVMSDNNKIIVPKHSALVLNLNGDLVIQKTSVDPFETFMQEAFDQKEDNPEVLLQDVLLAIENAKQDRRIKTLILDLHGLRRAGLDKLQQITAAMEDFKTSGKPIYAIGDYFTQNQYYLAAHADHVYLNPMGGISLDGYGTYPLYFKEALEKLKATTHVFRVGTYKSAVEPFMRNDMSEAAKEANAEWLGALWQQYKTDVARARNLDIDAFDETFEDFLAKIEAVDGDLSAYALENGWVDALKTRAQIRAEMREIVGNDDSRLGFTAIGLNSYLRVIKPATILMQSDLDKVGIVVAKGTILNGNQKDGTIGGDSTARKLRKALEDDSVKSVVLYIDSPGGSAFASEVIRQEIEELKGAGKPVVAAMSTYAASGGYWIAASADEIWAAPNTITGSIGIFGLLMTYENTLNYLGLHTDGVGTTDFAGFSPARALDPTLSNIIQRGIEHGYQQFISLVAKERDMTMQQVDEIAQGRVWIGNKAHELGLVDNIGYLQDAVKAAAALANLESYDTKYIDRDLSSSELFWQEFFGQTAAWIGKLHFANSDSQLIAMVSQLVSEFDNITKLNDPRGVYAFCLQCEY
ncbi:signal peptide peptidase SppA [Aestuariibacter salexigens]|uniref:signal peptide peptidase SppA n=1 Tax=Aestuariibacter salexigens TaxID=226010 RepID=UPI000478C43A|nr:signal peptide peptidase SppA [Aestuariibacter salexigens]